MYSLFLSPSVCDVLVSMFCRGRVTNDTGNLLTFMPFGGYSSVYMDFMWTEEKSNSRRDTAVDGILINRTDVSITEYYCSYFR